MFARNSQILNISLGMVTPRSSPGWIERTASRGSMIRAKGKLMNDGESRFHLLAVCTTLRDHLKQTEKLASAVERLLTRDPELRAQYEAEQKKEGNLENYSLPDADKILFRLQQEIQALGGEDRS